jgi:hypothetical protein
MSLVKRADGMYLIRQEPLQFGTLNQARSFFKIGLQNALDLAADLRRASIECYAASDAGTISDPNYVEPTATTDLTVRWPGDWQVEIEELGPSRYVIRFVDEFQVQRTVLGRSPHEAIDKIQMQSLVDPAVRNYLESITPVPEVAPAPAPETEAPRKFLRPGDRAITEQDLVEMEARRAEFQKPKTPPIQIEYQNFYEKSSSAAIKDRLRSDPEFLDWLNSTGALAPRSTTDASRNA